MLKRGAIPATGICEGLILNPASFHCNHPLAWGRIADHLAVGQIADHLAVGRIAEPFLSSNVFRAHREVLSPVFTKPFPESPSTGGANEKYLSPVAVPLD